MPLAKSLGTDNILHSFPEITVFDSAGVSRNVYIEEITEISTGIDNIQVIDPGINYTSAPTVTIIGDGSGATATAEMLGGRIQKITVTNRGSGYSSALVELSGGEGTGATSVPILQSRIGRLQSYYYKSNREKVIVNSNFGTINYDTGTISINSLRSTSVIENDFYEDGYMTINVLAEDENIFANRNRILSIDFADARSFQINVVSE
mgnify:CR=1 FL=1